MSHPPVVAISLSLIVLSVGCRRVDEIRTYRVPKEEPTSRTATTVEPTHRLLAAIIPLGNQAWFFKAVGTLDQMEQTAPQLIEFYESLSVNDDGQVTWNIPDDWQESAGNEMRMATITVPAGEETIELSVTQLPWTGDGTGGVLANVNRWRGQMGLPVIGPAGLAECTQKLNLGEHVGTLVDLAGSFSSGGMTAPFASAGARDAAPTIHELHPPIAPAGITFDAPAGWQPLPVPPGGLRKAAFAVIEEGAQAEFTAMDFPKGATAMADPLANVNRWLSELGRGPITTGELEPLSDQVTIDGHEGTLFHLEADASAERPEATLAAMVEKGDLVWFFKLRGDRGLVHSQQDQFRAFLDSVRFESAQEGEHGDD